VAVKRPAISGTAGTGPGDSAVTIERFQGAAADGVADITLTATPGQSGAYTVAPAVDLAEGSWTVRAKQSDSTGTTAAGPLTFTVDTVAPALGITSPAVDAALPTSTPVFTGRAGTAAGDAESVSLTLTGPVSRSLQTRRDSGGAFQVGTSALPDGRYRIVAAQQDAAGNIGQSSPVSFTLDTVAPAGVFTGGPLPARSGTRTVAFEFGADEAATFRCELDGVALAGPCASPLVLAALPAGGHELAAVAVDAAGNEDPTPARLRFAIDVPPRIGVAGKVSMSRRGAVSLVLKCPTAQALGPCAGRLTLRRPGRALLRKPIPFRIRPGGQVRVRGRLTPAATRLLRRDGELAVQFVLVGVDGRGNVGRARLRRTLVYPK
jgi:hypothetical protein